jgi:hypothetical protein
MLPEASAKSRVAKTAAKHAQMMKPLPLLSDSLFPLADDTARGLLRRCRWKVLPASPHER